MNICKIKSKPDYSYQDCWNYFLSILSVAVDLDKDKQRDLIQICQVEPAKFWSNFQVPVLSLIDYRDICYKIRHYQKNNVPVAYLNKEVYFYNSYFQIKKGVFIPQKDTEILLENTLKIINKYWNNKKNLKILDIGSGCGCLAICLAKHNPFWSVTAIDISTCALNIIKKNIVLNKVNNVKPVKSNLFSDLKNNEKYDIIISNPPYLSKQSYNKLSLLAKQQPKEALLSKKNSYWFYQEIIKNAAQYLNNKFLVAFEIGFRQKKKIIELIRHNFAQVKIEIFFDLSQKERVIAFYNL